MSALLRAKARLLEEDAEIAGDERLLTSMLEGDEEAGDCFGVIDRMLRAALHAERMAAAAKSRKEEIQARQERYAARAVTLRTGAFEAMQALSLSRRELPDLTASIRNGQPSVYVTDETVLPDQYWKVTREPRKSDIKRAIQGGAEVPGATLSNAPQTLSISTR